MTDDNHSGPDGGSCTVSMWANASMIGDFLVQYPGIWGLWNTSNGAETVEVPTPSQLPHGSATAQAGFLHAFTGGINPRTVYTAVNTYLPLLDFGGRWNHWAWVKTPSSMIIYQNGLNVAEIDVNNQPGDPNAGIYGPIGQIPVGSIHIGIRGTNWAMWSGKIADFQVYDYALDANEVAYLATDGTGQLSDIPLSTRSQSQEFRQSDTRKIVDFQDLAVMGNQWHQIQLWP